MTEGLFCSFFTEERMDMKNNITAQIESGYGDLRKSEKQAADYILDHMEEAAELPLNRLAEAAKVSQPTVLRMLKAVGYAGYRDFRYQLVAELAKTGGAGKKQEPDCGDRLCSCFLICPAAGCKGGYGDHSACS